MIKTYLEQAIRGIEAEREQKIAVLKDRITREKIAPFNAEVDTFRARALAEIDNELNAKMVALRKEYDAKKQEIVALGEEKKKSNAENVYSAELAVITVDYDSALSKLNAQLAEIKE